MTAIFLSHNHRDGPRANALKALLEATGDQVFSSGASLVPGEAWERAVLERLAGADVVLVLWSRFSAVSRWVQREIEIALRAGKKVVPAPLDETPLEGALAAIQAADVLPLVDDVLALARQLRQRGVSEDVADEAVRDLLATKGITLDDVTRRRVLPIVTGASVGIGVWGVLSALATTLTRWPILTAASGALLGAGAVVIMPPPEQEVVVPPAPCPVCEAPPPCPPPAAAPGDALGAWLGSWTLAPAPGTAAVAWTAATAAGASRAPIPDWGGQLLGAWNCLAFKRKPPSSWPPLGCGADCPGWTGLTARIDRTAHGRSTSSVQRSRKKTIQAQVADVHGVCASSRYAPEHVWVQWHACV